MVYAVLIRIAMVANAAAVFWIVYSFLQKMYSKTDSAFARINRSFQKKEQIEPQSLKLSRLGIMYRLKNYELTPGYYMVLRIVIGVMIGAIGLLVKVNLLCFAVGFAIGYFLVPFYFKYENGKDNEAITVDIYNTYANIKLQMSAGVYIRDVLEYTYKMVENQRYKEALGELIINFADKTVSSSEAVTTFKNRFSSHEIDKLSALIESFLKYGLNTEHASDIMSEIEGLIQANTMKVEHDIETKAEATNFAFFAIIIAMVVFIAMQSFSLGGVF